MGELERVNNSSSESSERGTKRTPSSMRKWITDQVAALGLAMGDEVSTERLLLYAEDLSDISQERLVRAFQRARREYEYPKLPPIAFIRKMAGVGEGLDGRPGPEEAWAKMPKGERMEDDSVVWCEEEQIAYGACRSLLLDGDLIGARMAFKERYEKEMAEAHSQRRPVRWSVSAGYDVEHRLTILSLAVQEKRISVGCALNFVPEQRRDDFVQMLPPAQSKGLLVGKAQQFPDLPGLPGILAKMQMQGLVPDELKPDSGPTQEPTRELSLEDLRKRREELRAQIEFLKHSRKAPGSGAA